jgi:hypothetical protein
MVTLSAETRIGSDHTPLILDSGEGLLRRSNHFFFETSWLAMPEFKEMLHGIWNRLLISLGGRRDAIDSWHIQSVGLSQYLKGWGGRTKENWKGRQQQIFFLRSKLLMPKLMQLVLMRMNGLSATTWKMF